MKPYLKSIVTAAVIAVLVFVFSVHIVAPQFPPAVGRPDLQATRSEAWDGIDAVHIDNPSGFVVVEAMDTAQVEVEIELMVFLRNGASEEAVRSWLEQVPTYIEEEALLRIVTEADERPEAVDVLAFYRVKVPEGTELGIRIVNGNVRVTGGCGDIEVKGRNTDVLLAGPNGKVDVETSNGRILMKGAAEGGNLRTINGSVYAHVLGGNLRASTANGLVDADLAGQEMGACHLTSENGDIKVALHGTTSGRVRALTTRGKVTCSFELAAGVRRGRHVEGVFGAAGDDADLLDLELETLNGDIRISKGKS